MYNTALQSIRCQLFVSPDGIVLRTSLFLRLTKGRFVVRSHWGTRAYHILVAEYVVDAIYRRPVLGLRT